MAKTKKKSVTFDLPRKVATVSAMDEEVESDEDFLPDNENIISASEDEDAGDDERKHTKLLEAISGLGGRRRKKMTERSEASLQVSEFGVNAEGAGEKVALSDLLSSATEASRTDGTMTKTHRQLKNLEKRQATLELPLSHQQTEKIQREAAFEKASKEVSRWESTIVHQQRAEQLFFPLNQQPSRPRRMEQLVTSWKTQTPLEQEVFALLHAHRQPTFDPVLTPVEEAQLQAMSLEEAQLRRAELQKARALQSYYEAKAKRGSKIKSKKYHKVQQKAKRKAFLKQFEDLCKSDPERAMEELQNMEKKRIEERMSLKHQNSGKWAKSRVIMAKYDLGARQAMHEQLELNRQLTHKPLPSSELHDDSDDDSNSDPTLASEDQTLPDIVNEASANQKEGANPWMKMAVVLTTAEQEEPKAVADSETPEAAVSDAGEVGEEREEETEEERLLGEFARRRQLRRTNDEEEEDKEARQTAEASQTDGASEVSPSRADRSDDDDDGDEDEEDQMDEAAASELNALFGRLAKQAQQGAAPLGSSAELLDEDTTRVRTLEQAELLAETHNDTAPPVAQVESEEAAPGHDVDDPAPKGKGHQKVIDPEQVLTKQARSIRVPMTTPAIEDAEDEALDEQTDMIREAFAGDDVVSDFLKEKRKQEEEGRPKDVDLSLPGWGEWGGVGIHTKKQKRKRSRFLKKAPPAAPRKDRKLPAVIISEKRDASVAAHQVSQLPFPFENPSQFERSIRSPLGSTWNPELAVRKLTAPRIVTKAGAIIEPISRDDIMPAKAVAGKRRAAPDIQLGGDAERRGGHHRPGAKKKKHKK
ncbi:U3 small nucleolar RNA-associated protein 14 homolog A isoform X1 [Clupea harengus]|uniref:U3 small nucleolar RNA-associated protein 14 homolog A isoform X1 n=1 Tax=Clupea harengus TaxID=7950 RepID=A0A6P8FGB8_CLUHA|nr:U3 small nucleolar RNA-associated protein 14 homolog A isoform X1 [Clupea harengus]